MQANSGYPSFMLIHRKCVDMATGFLINLRKIDTLILSLFYGRIWSRFTSSIIQILKLPNILLRKNKNPLEPPQLWDTTLLCLKWEWMVGRNFSFYCKTRTSKNLVRFVSPQGAIIVVFVPVNNFFKRYLFCHNL